MKQSVGISNVCLFTLCIKITEEKHRRTYYVSTFYKTESFLENGRILHLLDHLFILFWSPRCIKYIAKTGHTIFSCKLMFPLILITLYKSIFKNNNLEIIWHFTSLNTFQSPYIYNFIPSASHKFICKYLSDKDKNQLSFVWKHIKNH